MIRRASKSGIKKLENEIKGMHYAMETAYVLASMGDGRAVKKLRDELSAAYRKLETMKIEYATAA